MIDDQDRPIPVLELIARDESMTLPFKTERPTWREVEKSLMGAFVHGGHIMLDVRRPDTTYIRRLTMDSLPGKYRIDVLTRDENPKKEYLVWWEPGDAPFRGTDIMHDDEWDARTFCTDINVAMALFRQMYEQGDLNREDLKDMRSLWFPKP